MAREMAGPKFKFPYSQKKSGMAANTPVALALLGVQTIHGAFWLPA